MWKTAYLVVCSRFLIYTQVEQKGINKTLNFWLFAELGGTKLWTIDSTDNLCMAKNEQSITHNMEYV